jgi:hypothetical protein
MENKLSQDLETRLSAAERLCNFFNKKNEEKTDQFKPIIKQTDIKDKLTLDIDGTPYQIDGVHISHRYMPEEYFDVAVNFHNEELKNKFMSQIEATCNPKAQPHKWDVVFRNVLLDDSEGKRLFDYFNVIVTSIDLGEQDTSALLYMDYWRIHDGSGSKYEKQLFNDLMLNSEELAYVQKAQIEQRGWYAECDD